MMRALAFSVVWFVVTGLTRASEWPDLPQSDGGLEIPAQVWPLRPGPRNIRIRISYPGGTLDSVNAQTGVMLTLHNWGGEDCAGTANPDVLARRLNVVAVCVNYLQSGRKDAIDSPEPYDFGYLQALDALRALWFVCNGLQRVEQPFDIGRLYCTGGSGGGNVTLMANKLAPRTFACVVDMCGMKKLSHDIAFNLPGGSGLDARWSRDPSSANYLSCDHQQLRFVGHPAHLQTTLLHDGCQMAKFTYAAIRGAAFMQYPKRSQLSQAKTSSGDCTTIADLGSEVVRHVSTAENHRETHGARALHTRGAVEPLADGRSRLCGAGVPMM